MLNIGKLDHVAVAVPRIRDALPLYQDLLGGEYIYGGDHLEQGYRWIQFAYPGPFKIELMEPLSDDGFLQRFLDTRGPGMHHMLFYVDDMEASIAEAEAAGYQVVGAHLDPSGWSEAFLHPKSTDGVLIELGKIPAGSTEPSVPGEFAHSLDALLDGAMGGRRN